jgi:hypothetical protein
MTREHQGNYSEQCVDFHDWFELDYNRECDTTGSRGGQGVGVSCVKLGHDAALVRKNDRNPGSPMQEDCCFSL